MRKVVDSNYLRHPDLRVYLSASRQNAAVITDYMSMEAYKGNTLSTLYDSMSILAEFPAQVLILKSTLVVCGLNGRNAGLQRRFIDESQTRGFGIYCEQLEAAKAGNVAIQRELLAMGREARQHLEERMLADTQNIPALIADIAGSYTKEERAALREGATYSELLIKKMIGSVLLIADSMFSNHPRIQKLPHEERLPNTFIFRSALCVYLLALDWIAHAGADAAKGASAWKLRNDMVDITFAAYATYFDDLLSHDGKPLRIHGKARLLLASVFGCQISGI